ncbi:MAG: hypothetical protein Q4A71_00810 [Actinomycetaceae bacterium]|nr:hypothetical protein [Actinomycetaceae bacterium]
MSKKTRLIAILVSMTAIFASIVPALPAIACGYDGTSSLDFTQQYVKSSESKLLRLASKGLLPQSLKTEISRGNYTILDGTNQAGNESVKILLHDQVYVLSTLKDSPNLVSFARIQANMFGDVSQEDALIETPITERAVVSVASTSGYYGNGCVKWKTTCLKNLVNNACNSAKCIFIAWTPWLTASCLSIHCSVAVSKCCAKWKDGYWHEW